MNNRQSGRRRGRNNNNNQRQPSRGGGNHDSGNRIDSRARGNAAQLLEKYRNMARDAQMSGDRVMTEYYLQFADHYFRVLSDARARQEEQRARFEERYDDRDSDGADADDAEGDNGGEEGAELDPIDMIGRAPRTRERRDDRGERNDRYDRGDRNDRGERNQRNGHREGQTREGQTRDSQPRDNNRSRNGYDRGNGHGGNDEPAGIDLAVLRPAIGMSDSPAAADHESDHGDEAPAAPRRRGRPRKAAAGEETAAE